MGKYKRLLSNTAILGAGTFASKVLVLLLMPFYTSVLTTSDFGTADLISQTANLLIPLAAVGICDGIFRFTLDSGADPKRILSTGIAVLLCGSLGLCSLIWILGFFEVFQGYVLLITAYVIAANLHAAFANYLRARGQTALFAAQGILNTVLTIGLNLLFLLVFELSAVGYVLSVVVADFTVTLVLFFVARLWRDISFRNIDRGVAKDMLKFSVPYIPTTVMWLITSVSDRYVVTAFRGEAENGLYAAAYKLPTLLSLVSGVFVEAWHFSTVKDADEEEKSSFFGEVYLHFMSVIFIGGSVIIAAAKPFTDILLADSYYTSWRYVPILVIATTFSTFVSFLGSVYFMRKKSMMSMLTAMVGAVTNLILNFLLIPRFGAMGAAVATLISYVTVYVVRGADTKKYLRFKLHTLRILINTAVLTAQAVILLIECPYWILIEIALLTFVLIFNGKGLVVTAMRMLRHIFGKKSKKY